MDEFKVGDVVELKSGGPPMTIQSKTADKWFCTWTEADGTTTGSGFLQSSLLKKAAP